MTAATADRLGHIRQDCGTRAAQITHRAKGEQCRICWPGDGLPATPAQERQVRG